MRDTGRSDSMARAGDSARVARKLVRRLLGATIATVLALGTVACDNGTPDKDPHVQRGGGDIKDDPACCLT